MITNMMRRWKSLFEGRRTGLRTAADTNRREFLRDGVRYGLLSVLAAVAGLNLRKSRAQGCLERPMCEACPAFEDCSLPKAQATRRGERVERGACERKGPASCWY